MSKSQRGPKPKLLKSVPLSQQWEAAGRGLSAAARSAFNHAVDLLRQRGSLDTTDVELVVAYAQTIEVRDTAYAELQKTGLLIESDRHNISANPAEKIHAAACLRLKILAAEMGLTPGSAKLAAGQKSNDPYQALRSKLGGKPNPVAAYLAMKPPKVSESS
jgi:P27 family predicted phage terminase small subunit